MMPPVVQTRTKDYPVETKAIRWPVSMDKMRKREDRILLRAWPRTFSTFEQLRQETIRHDLFVLRKWLIRGLRREKALLVNQPNTESVVITPDVLEYRITQKAIKYDPDVHDKYKDYEYLMLPDHLGVFRLVFLDDPSGVFNE